LSGSAPAVLDRQIDEHDPRHLPFREPFNEDDSAERQPEQQRVKEDRHQEAVDDYGALPQRAAQLSAVEHPDLSPANERKVHRHSRSH
jgi:hypothetical protein